MEVNLEDVQKFLALRRKINRLSKDEAADPDNAYRPIESIVWKLDGKPVPPPADLDEWRFTGLSNFCFAEMVLLGMDPEKLRSLPSDWMCCHKMGD